MHIINILSKNKDAADNLEIFHISDEYRLEMQDPK